MNVPNTNALAVFRWVGVRVEINDAAVRRFLMAVVCNRADRNRERGKRARLPLVLTGFNKMEQMIVRPMASLNNRAALSVPCDAVGIACAFADDLEFARARMHSPQRAVEFV